MGIEKTCSVDACLKQSVCIKCKEHLCTWNTQKYFEIQDGSGSDHPPVCHVDCYNKSIAAKEVIGGGFVPCSNCNTVIDRNEYMVLGGPEIHLCSETCFFDYSKTYEKITPTYIWDNEKEGSILAGLKHVLNCTSHIGIKDYAVSLNAKKSKDIMEYFINNSMSKVLTDLKYQLIKHFVEQKDLECLKFMSDKWGISSSKPSDECITEIYIAAISTGDDSIVDEIIDQLPDNILNHKKHAVHSYYTKENKYIVHNLLVSVVKTGNVAMFRNVINRYAVCKEVIVRNDNVVLKEAACHGQLSIIKYMVKRFNMVLLDVYCNIDFIVIAASEYMHFEVSEYLLSLFLQQARSMEALTKYFILSKICKNVKRRIVGASSARQLTTKKSRSDEEEYYCMVKYEFKKYDNELNIKNGSSEFFAFRKKKISASKIAAFCGVSKYSTPQQAARNFYAPYKSSPDTERGIIGEQLVRQLLFQFTQWRMPIRECGIFHVPDTEHSAMPDDIAFLAKYGVEIIIEYKYTRYGRILPDLGYVFQTIWQMGIVGLKHAFLVFQGVKACASTGDDQFSVWHIEFSNELFDFEWRCALEARPYINNPVEELLPTTPYIYNDLQRAFDKNEWVPGHCIHNLPPAPKIKRITQADITELFF